MCLNPSFVWLEQGPAYVQQPVPCKVCWQCKASRLNDYVGRSLAEASCSSWTCAITLTYRPRLSDGSRDPGAKRHKSHRDAIKARRLLGDDLADKRLTPRHFQAAVRALRKRDHSVRYLVAGEYGEERGRSHFHALLFFDGPAPQVAHLERDWVDWWPHGHVFADWSAGVRAVHYVCKYILKDRSSQTWFSLSKKPALGADFFTKLADRYIDLEVMPRSFNYTPPGGKKANPYLMTGATRRDFLKRVRDGLLTRRPDLRAGLDEWVAKSLEKLETAETVARNEQWQIDNPDQAIAALVEDQDRERLSERQAIRIALQGEQCREPDQSPRQEFFLPEHQSVLYERWKRGVDTTSGKYFHELCTWSEFVALCDPGEEGERQWLATQDRLEASALCARGRDSHPSPTPSPSDED